MQGNRSLHNIYRFVPFFNTFRYIGYASIIPIVLIIMLVRSCNSYCISTISRSPSPGGHISAVVLDCWPQVGFGGQTIDQNLIVNLVDYDEEKKLNTTLNSCDYSDTAILSIWNEDSRNRPLLHWLSSNHLEVMIPDGSKITLFKTSFRGITVDWAFEKSEDQKIERLHETSGEPEDFSYPPGDRKWYCQ